MCGNATSLGVLFAVILVRDVAGATHGNAQEAPELDWMMRVRTSSLSDAFTFKSSPRTVPTLSTQTNASSTLAVFLSWYLRAVAPPVALRTTVRNWHGESCVFGDLWAEVKLATL